jgi:hypothetical protein
VFRDPNSTTCPNGDCNKIFALDVHTQPALSFREQIRNIGCEMRALFQARLEDWGPDDRIKVECAACKRTGRIAATGLGLPPYTAVLDLK